ncbi:DEKNAAC101920 [Brettanomyces naardenensis]|uniref:DEKNAAC101920 n=1 Tax=Brettanomyces naardenensis TaxID=13370 RepID=A0A448YJJ9_BRENA|nr:DEKNAAC101920 [Brettanomyces naardenensis]
MPSQYSPLDNSSTASAPADLTPFPGSTGQTSNETDEEVYGNNEGTYGYTETNYRSTETNGGTEWMARKSSGRLLGVPGGSGIGARGVRSLSYGVTGDRVPLLRERNSYHGSNPFSTGRLHSPSLVGTRSRGASLASLANSVRSVTQMTIEQLRRRRFLSVSIFGVIFILLFNLIFMPRTSLDRDLRRFHGEYLTFDDCTRLFLTHLSMANAVPRWLDLQRSEIHSPGENYQSTVDLLHTYPFRTSAEKYETWFGKSTDTSLKLYSPEGKLLYDARLQESQLFSSFAYSADGDVKAKYIYANYGSDEDFATLKRVGITISGHIVVMRSGHAHPSIKIRNAENMGAVGAIIYSDPYDDGKFTKTNGFPEFPEGFARNKNAVVKDTANFILSQPGDPTTPGWSSTLFSKRVKPQTIPKIPVLPISYNAIQPILSSFPKGADFGWKGDLNGFSYTGGISSNTLHLRNSAEFAVNPIYNVITEIRGIIGDEEILVGASRDVIGGIGGASSGYATLLEIARGFGELARRGWKPLRTIRLVSWDGSSFGQLGSTEFGEFYAKKLTKNAITYVNLDGVKGSQFLLESNPLFNNLLITSMKHVMVDDESTLWDYYSSQRSNSSTSIDAVCQRPGDYLVFQSHLGVPSVNIGFSNDPKRDPIPYENSKYDSVDWLRSFDKELQFHNLAAQFAGLFILHLSEKEIIHVESNDYLSGVRDRFEVISKEIPADWMQKKVITEKCKKSKDCPTFREEMDEISSLLDQLLEVCEKFDLKLVHLQQQILHDYPWFKLYIKIKIAFQIKMANAKTKSLDKLFIAGPEFTNSETDKQKDGLLAGRKWFQHLVFAPDAKTGDHVQLLPGLTESLISGNSDFFAKNIAATHIALEKVYKKFK